MRNMSNMLYAKDEYRGFSPLCRGRAGIHCSYRPYTASERSERSPSDIIYLFIQDNDIVIMIIYIYNNNRMMRGGSMSISF